MRTARLIGSSLTSAAIALACAAVNPASAHEMPGPDPEWRFQGQPLDGYDFDRVRADWLEECHRRVDHGARLPGPYQGPEACEAFLHDFYARGGPPPAFAHHSWGYPPSAYATAAGCCASVPMMMVPVMMPAKVEPDCTETIEYVYEDVPAPTRARRAIPRRPDKRIRVAPGKRVRTN